MTWARSGSDSTSSSSSVPPSASSISPALRPGGAGVGGALVAEELVLDQLRRDGAAVDRHERLLVAAREVVDRAREELLAGAGLARDQHVGVAARDERQLLDRGDEARRLAVEVQPGELRLQLAHRPRRPRRRREQPPDPRQHVAGAQRRHQEVGDAELQQGDDLVPFRALEDDDDGHAGRPGAQRFDQPLGHGKGSRSADGAEHGEDQGGAVGGGAIVRAGGARRIEGEMPQREVELARRAEDLAEGGPQREARVGVEDVDRAHRLGSGRSAA